MAHLEALTRIDPIPGLGWSELREYGRRFDLPLAEPVRLGSDERHCPIAVPEDRMIPRFAATLTWDGEALMVAARGAMPHDFAPPAGNQIWFHNKPVLICVVKPGEWFVIGQTRFTVLDAEPVSDRSAARDS